MKLIQDRAYSAYGQISPPAFLFAFAIFLCFLGFPKRIVCKKGATTMPVSAYNAPAFLRKDFL